MRWNKKQKPPKKEEGFSIELVKELDVLFCLAYVLRTSLTLVQKNSVELLIYILKQ